MYALKLWLRGMPVFPCSFVLRGLSSARALSCNTSAECSVLLGLYATFGNDRIKIRDC